MTAPSITFHTNLSAFGNNTGIVVPPDALETLGAGKRPAVEVDVNGYRYRSTVGSMNGRSLISVSKAMRSETGLAAGDPIDVTLTLATAPREVELPSDFAAALDAAPGTRGFFDGLSNSLQRYHVDTINDAKTAETRARRIERSIGLFAAGKKR
jgi:antitoxin component of MazEF toxin-antitoxin module